MACLAGSINDSLMKMWRLLKGSALADAQRRDLNDRGHRDVKLRKLRVWRTLLRV